MCVYAERDIKYSSREIAEGLPYMKSNNVPPCLWSYGYHLTLYYDNDDDYQLKFFESITKFEVEKYGSNEYTMDRLITQIEKGKHDVASNLTPEQ